MDRFHSPCPSVLEWCELRWYRWMALRESDALDFNWDHLQHLCTRVLLARNRALLVRLDGRCRLLVCAREEAAAERLDPGLQVAPVAQIAARVAAALALAIAIVQIDVARAAAALGVARVDAVHSDDFSWLFLHFVLLL